MALYSGNKDYLSIDGVELAGFWRDTQIVATVDMAENTSGNAQFKSRFETLRDYSMSFTIAYDDEEADMILNLVRPGKHLVVYGPEGNVAGKPKHQQYFIFPQVETEGDSEKSQLRVFSVSANAAEAPLFDMYNGGVF